MSNTHRHTRAQCVYITYIKQHFELFQRKALHKYVLSFSYISRYTPALPGMHVNEEVWNELKSVYLDDRYAPLMAEKFDKLPPTFMYVGIRDVVRDDSEFYRRQLEQAGVKVEYIMDPEGYHGSFWLANPKQQELYKQIKTFLNSL